MKVTIDDKEIKMIEVSKLIGLLKAWDNRKYPNYVAISDTGHVCLIEQLRSGYNQFGVINFDIEQTTVFDEGF